jgi:hypothetical protein
MQSVCYLQLLIACFESVHLTKPESSSLSSNQLYVIARGYQPKRGSIIVESVLTHFEQLVKWGNLPFDMSLVSANSRLYRLLSGYINDLKKQ